MIYLKWTLIKLFEWVVLFPTLLVVPQIIAIFTREQPHNLLNYSWGGLWGTFDNPPQGDEGFVSNRAFFTNCTTGLKGYVNRVQWMWRNKLYGFNKLTSLKWSDEQVLEYTGNPDISDKYKVSGKYFAKLYLKGKLVGFEFYCILPWSDTRDLRCRVGWKMMSDKFKSTGFAPLVGTCNPFDGYGND